MSSVVEQALRAAEIPPERHGAARARPLTAAQRALYFWVLREFAAARPPSADAARAAAEEFGLDPSDAVAVLAREDLVHPDATGRPIVAYPFSAEPRGHRVLIAGKHRVEAMCAIDALGIAPMLGLPIEVLSRDPVSGGEVRVQLGPTGAGSWQPSDAVVLAGSSCRAGPSFHGCCDVLNFFASRESAARYLDDHPHVSGHPISVPEAIEVGRVVFAHVFEEG